MLSWFSMPGVSRKDLIASLPEKAKGRWLMFQRILIPLDGSVRAERAISVAARLARASKGMLILVRVVNTISEYEQATSLFQTTIQSEREEARRYLAGLVSSHQLADCSVIVSVPQGPVVATIQAAIAIHQADLLVCCEPRGLRASPHFPGSFAEKLSSRLSIPLLLLPAREPLAGFLGDNEQPVACLVAFAGSQPEAFLIPPATALLAALAHQGPAHLHFAPLCAVLSYSARTHAGQQAQTGSKERLLASKQGAVQLPEACLATNDRWHGRADVIALAVPFPDDDDLLQEMYVCPRLLIPLPEREQ